jgi:spore germination protein GerM
MTRRRYTQIVIGVVVLGLLAWGVTRALERLVAPAPASGRTGPADATAPAAVAHITAILFYASADGQALVPLRREVPLAEGVIPQGRQILALQLEPPPSPYVSAIPAGTMLRAFYVTERGDAFVDLSAEVAKNHPGGSFTEMLTVYAIVNAVTANLPTIQRVQILIDGREAETLAGHVDLRRPLVRDVTLVREPET